MDLGDHRLSKLADKAVDKARNTVCKTIMKGKKEQKTETPKQPAMLQSASELMNQKQYMEKPQSMPVNLGASAKEMTGKSSSEFRMDEFMAAHNPSNIEVINPEKKVQKLLVRLVDLYVQVMDDSIFDAENCKIIKKDRIADFKAQALELRRVAFKKLS